MIEFTLNGKAVSTDAPQDTPLLWVIRDEFGLKGTKFGCGIAQCGACTVHVDGSPGRSCSIPLAQAAGKAVTTIDFGQVTYLEDFQRTLSAGGVGITDAVDLKVGRSRTFRLIEGRLAS